MLDGYIPPLIVLVLGACLLAGRYFYFTRFKKRKSHAWEDAVFILLIIALAGVLEFGMGRTPTYKYGPVRFWSGNINSNQNSQQIADPYTFTHIIHGAALYGLTRLVPASLGAQAMLAVSIESAWEVLENTNMVINRYRAETISLDYYGDSIINSLFDIVACLAGFFIASRLPGRVTLVGCIIIEIALAYWIRDNLTLNIIMLLYPIPALRAWQMGM